MKIRAQTRRCKARSELITQMLQPLSCPNVSPRCQKSLIVWLLSLSCTGFSRYTLLENILVTLRGTVLTANSGASIRLRLN